MSAPLEQSLRATSIQSTPMSAQSAAHALTFVRQKLSAFPKEYAEFYVVKNNEDCPQGSPRLFISHFSFKIYHQLAYEDGVLAVLVNRNRLAVHVLLVL